MNNTQLPEPANRGAIWLLGVVVATVVTAALYGAICLLYVSVENRAFQQAVLIFGIPSFFLVPLCGGVAASYCWRRLNPDVGEIALRILALTLLDLIAAAVILREGVICLLIVSPLLYGMFFTGAVAGRVWFKSDPTRLRFSVLPLLALLALGEPALRSDQSGVVVDEILIKAPPAKVWPELTSFPAIPEPPRFWMFRLGLPYPVETTTEGDFVGAGRRCVFSDNMVFEEKVVACVPQKDLTFDITGLPQHPELIGHITPSRGQFLLRDNGDGTSTLTGSTWYTLHVRPLWYFDWWTHLIFRAVHLRVMHDIRERAERG